MNTAKKKALRSLEIKILEHLIEHDHAMPVKDLNVLAPEYETTIGSMVLDLEEEGYVTRFRLEDDTVMLEATHAGKLAYEAALSAPRRAP